jgi:hypothetical protein
MSWGTLHSYEMNTLLAVILALSSSAVLLADGDKRPPVAAEVDPRVTLELRLGRRVAHFDINLAKNISLPTVTGISELSNMVHGIGCEEEASMSDAFRLTRANSVRSIPSRELAAHLDIMKSVKRIKGLLADANDAAEDRRLHSCKLIIEAVVKEFAVTRKLIAVKSKIRVATPPTPLADTNPQPDAKAKKPEAGKPDMAVKGKKA